MGSSAEEEEVSVRALMPIFDRWHADGHSVDELLALAKLAPERVARPDGWVGWRDFDRLCRVASERWDQTTWQQLGGGSLHGRWHRVLSVVGWLLPDEESILRWVADQATGVGGYAYRTLIMEVEGRGPRSVQVRLVAPVGESIPPGFAEAARGAFMRLPALIGLGEAEVSLRLDGAVASYRLHLPARSRWRRRAAAVVGFPWTALVSIRELKQAQERLTRDREALAEQGKRRREAEAEREVLARRLHQAEKMEAIGRLAGGVAHDFNNLLTIMLAHAELASMDASEAVREDLSVVIDTARRASELTEQLLTISRQQPAAVRVLDLAVELGEIEPVLRTLLPVGVTLDLTAELEDVRVQMARASLSRILSNLVANAGDAMEDGGRVRVSARRHVGPPPDATGLGLEPGPYVRVAVEDDGPGMPGEVAERIFEPFFTTKEAGTGLGLATVYGLVAQHRGQVQVTTAPGEGTQVEVFLPVVDAPLETPERKPRRPVRIGAMVWIVDDEPFVREVVERALTESGFRARSFDRAPALLAALSDGSRLPDLVLSDVVLPEMRGDVLASLLRERHPALPVVLMSGYPAPGGARIAAPEAWRLEKPFTIARLLEVVGEALAHAPAS